MKCTAAIVTECINIFVMGTCTSNQVVSYSYITFGIICRIDDLMCMTVDDEIRGALSKTKIKFSKNEAHLNVFDFSKRLLKDGIKPDVDGMFIVFQIVSFATYQIIKIMYTTFYFYFFPLLTMLMCNFIGDGKIYV